MLFQLEHLVGRCDQVRIRLGEIEMLGDLSV